MSRVSFGPLIVRCTYGEFSGSENAWIMRNLNFFFSAILISLSIRVYRWLQLILTSPVSVRARPHSLIAPTRLTMFDQNWI